MYLVPLSLQSVCRGDIQEALEENDGEIKINVITINNFRYTDDNLIIANS